MTISDELLNTMWAEAAKTWEKVDLLVLADALMDAGEEGMSLGVRYAAERGVRCENAYSSYVMRWWDGYKMDKSSSPKWKLEPGMATLMLDNRLVVYCISGEVGAEENAFGFDSNETALRAYAECHIEWSKDKAR